MEGSLGLLVFFSLLISVVSGQTRRRPNALAHQIVMNHDGSRMRQTAVRNSSSTFVREPVPLPNHDGLMLGNELVVGNELDMFASPELYMPEASKPEDGAGLISSEMVPYAVGAMSLLLSSYFSPVLRGPVFWFGLMYVIVSALKSFVALMYGRTGGGGIISRLAGAGALLSALIVLPVLLRMLPGERSATTFSFEQHYDNSGSGAVRAFAVNINESNKNLIGKEE